MFLAMCCPNLKFWPTADRKKASMASIGVDYISAVVMGNFMAFYWQGAATNHISLVTDLTC